MADEKRYDESTRRGFVKAAGSGVIGAALAGRARADARRTTAPRELLLYIGTYTSGASDPAGGSKGIYLYRLDLSDGSLTHAGTTEGVVNPSYLVLDGGRRFLYAVNEVEEFGGAASGAVSAFAVERRTGALRLLNQRASKGGAPCYVSVAAGGRFVLVANYVGGNVAVLPVLRDGSLGEASDVEQYEGSGPDRERQEAAHAHCVVLDGANRFAYACDLGTDRVMVYGFDGRTGALSPPARALRLRPQRAGLDRHGARARRGARHAQSVADRERAARGVHRGEHGRGHPPHARRAFPLRLEPRSRQPRRLRRQCADGGATAPRPHADRREHAAQLRHRADGPLPAGRQPEVGHGGRLPPRPAHGRAPAGGADRLRALARLPEAGAAVGLRGAARRRSGGGVRVGAMAPEGVYSGMERREVERYKVNLRARWQGRRAARDGMVTDISTAGCFVLADDLLVERGELVKVELLLPAGVVALWGHVIYTAEEIGFGVRYSPNIPESERRKLELLVRAEALRSQKRRAK
jgi:hypothetical protein